MDNLIVTIILLLVSTCSFVAFLGVLVLSRIKHSKSLTINWYHFEMSAANHVLRVRRLYKLIFRVHRALPTELRILGDNYAREEFKRHKNCNPAEANIFLHEWTDYAINIAKQTKPLHQAKRKTVGKYLDPKMLDYMSDDQIVQLYELHKATALQSDDPDQINVSNKDSTDI